MKQKKTATVLLIVVLALVLGGTAVAYRILSKRYKPEQPASTAAAEEQSGDMATQAPRQAADFTVYDAGGAEISLSEKLGKPVILNFWASWCPPCKAELPDFNEAYQNYGDRVEFMMIDLTDGYRETQEGAQAFSDENGYTFPLYFDLTGEAANAYGITSIPVTVAIDAEGNVVFSQVGALTHDALESVVAQILG